MSLTDETPIPGPIPEPPDKLGPLQRYRVAFDDGTIELHDGHAVSPPKDGMWRIHRCTDGVWQMVFGGRAELIRTIRAISSMEYDQLLRAQATLNTSLDHLGRLVAGLGECTQGFASGGYCDAAGHADTMGVGRCDAVTASKFLDELRPF